MGAIGNCLIECFQNGKNVMNLNKGCVIIRQAEFVQAPLIQPHNTCEMYGELFEENNPDLNSAMDVRIKTESHKELRGSFWVKLPVLYKKTIYFDLDGALTYITE